MTKIKNKKIYSKPLDSYEAELEEILNNGEYVSASKKDFEATKKMFEDAAKNHAELLKSKSVTIRVKNNDLIRVKAKAKEKGIPYQRIINMLIKDYAEDRTTITI